MRFPVHIMTDMLRWKLRNWARGNRRYPYVLMLEPLHTCNLACLGCSPERYSGDLKDRLSLEQCLAAVDDAGTPVVSICGGEPTIYPELKELVDGRKRFRGVIEGVEDDEVQLRMELDGKPEPVTIGLPFSLISEAKLVADLGSFRADLAGKKPAH